LSNSFQPHWKAITLACHAALDVLRRQSFIRKFYLAGGTALALQIGHRISQDLDWFSYTEQLKKVERDKIRRTLERIGQSVVTGEHDTMLFMRLSGAEVSFIYQHHPLVEPTVDLAGVALASPTDIGLMKLAAIQGRGTRRDFVDLYCLRRVVTLERLIDLAEVKYADRPGFLLTLARALTYFEDAEQQVMPPMLKRVRWADVKRYTQGGARYIVQRQREKAKR
jgi:predicted nucleotidyltransferase component of viral defense system